MMFNSLILALIVGLFHAASAQDAACPDNGAQTIAEIASANTTGQLSTLLLAMESANLTDVLSSAGPLDVFAPTNAAFDTLMEAYGMSTEDLLAETAFLTRVLQYHVIVGDGAVCSGVMSGSFATALPGESLIVSDMTVIDAEGNTANMTAALPASNGILYVIDSVLLPAPDAAAPGGEGGNENFPGPPVDITLPPASGGGTLISQGGGVAS